MSGLFKIQGDHSTVRRVAYFFLGGRGTEKEREGGEDREGGGSIGGMRKKRREVGGQ